MMIEAKSLVPGDLDNGGAGGDGVVGDSVLAASQNDVALAGDTLGHNDGETTRDGGGVNEDGASDGDESAVELAGAVNSLEGVAWGVEGDGVASLDGTLGAESQDGESLDWESDVGGWAGGDELPGEGVDLVKVQRGVEWCGEWDFAERSTDVGGVTGLDGQDGAGGGEVVGRHDVCGRAEVGADTDTLENGGERNEALGVRDTEVVCALGDGLSSSG